MFIKLGIMAIISVGVIMAFSSEINEYFPNTVTTGIESFKLDLNLMADQSIEFTEDRINTSSEKIKSQLTAAGDETLDSVGNTIEYTQNQIGSTTETLADELTELKDTSSDFVEENLIEKMEPLGVADALKSVSGT